MCRKKMFYLTMALAAMTVFISTGCDKPQNAETPAANTNKDYVEITEKMFIAQVNDVYLNAGDYMGKTIKLEGIFKTEQYYGVPEPYCFVIRYGPGCCGMDGNSGFEVKWEADQIKPYPDVESWVEAIGVLKTYEEDGFDYMYLELASLNTLSVRGAETVLQ